MKIKNIILAVFAGVLALTSCNQSLLDIPQKGVLNYENHNYIYFCARPEMDGRHNFARTLAEHNRNAAAYHRALDRMNVK